MKLVRILKAEKMTNLLKLITRPLYFLIDENPKRPHRRCSAKESSTGTLNFNTPHPPCTNYFQVNVHDIFITFHFCSIFIYIIIQQQVIHL